MTCCKDFQHHISWHCGQHSDPADCPDCIIHKYKSGYGIPIHDGGSSFILINNCPWCGANLNENRRSSLC